jgi:hypothetical protein
MWSIFIPAPDAWLARCGDRVGGPSYFNEAKANALAMAKGADGDYRIKNPVAHLNGLQAMLEAKEAQAIINANGPVQRAAAQAVVGDRRVA